ncbi:hypothetical protein [Micromonospora sp. NBC_00421]|uniref:hypothetical protein n=1 Tax=Micromonospora sp. NBC_00421 TaxID=2975976 RepID=UPI002E24608A
MTLFDTGPPADRPSSPAQGRTTGRFRAAAGATAVLALLAACTSIPTSAGSDPQPSAADLTAY